jgi:hypothetical protein
MSDFLILDILGDRNALRNMESMPDTVRAILLVKTEDWVDELESKVINNILDRLQEKSGDLLNSVTTEVGETGSRVFGRVSVNTPYAKAQDTGAVTPPHVILPRDAKILAFIGATGDKVFATRVFHPGAVIPGTRYMKDAYRDMSSEISRGVKTSIVQGIRAKMRSSRS